MEDFGYKKTADLNKNKTLLSKKIFFISATLLSFAIFFYITIKAYFFINQNSNSRNIETIKGANFPIKVVENNEYEKNNEDNFNSSIYENILNRHKNTLEKENIKINKHQEPAYPPEENKEISNSEYTINNLEKNIKKINNYNKKQFKEIIIENTESKPAKRILNDKDKSLNILNNKTEIKENNSNNTQLKAPIIINKISDEIKESDKINPNPENKKDLQNNASPKKYKSIRVQISAMSSKQNCEDYYQKLLKQYSKLFSKRKNYIEEANLGKRGLFYRLQIGDFFNQIEAEEFCTKFISQTQKSRSECIIVE